jgi:glycoside/pentoside/hexuronide:cation symporter, GPH family
MIKNDNAIRDVLTCYSLSMLGSALPAALFYYYVRDVLGAEAYIVHFLALYLVPGIVAWPLWKKAAQRYGTASAWLAAMVFTVIVFIGVCFLGKGDIVPYGIICIFSGLTFGAEFMLPAMIMKKIKEVTDTNNNTMYHSMHHSTHNTLGRYGTLAFLGKVMGVLGCVPLLLFTGMIELSAAQRHDALVALYGFVPCLVKTASAFVLWRWIKTYGGQFEKTSTPITSGDSHAA